jgi:epoxide hydrolase-like predicted phosphatase
VPIPNEIKNVIFDLGGVILNLDTELTYQAFAGISGINVKDVKSKAASLNFFNEYERGAITDGQFRERISEFLGIQAADEVVDLAWNAMLLDLPASRLQLLNEVSKKFRTFLLSNTNGIHLTCFRKIEKNNLQPIDTYFEAAYFSHLINMRKPDQEIFEYVLNQNQLKATETLFLDDNLANLQGASAIGIHTVHIQHPDMIFSLFNESTH